MLVTGALTQSSTKVSKLNPSACVPGSRVQLKNGPKLKEGSVFVDIYLPLIPRSSSGSEGQRVK